MLQSIVIANAGLFLIRPTRWYQDRALPWLSTGPADLSAGWRGAARMLLSTYAHHSGVQLLWNFLLLQLFLSPMLAVSEGLAQYELALPQVRVSAGELLGVYSAAGLAGSAAVNAVLRSSPREWDVRRAGRGWEVTSIGHLPAPLALPRGAGASLMGLITFLTLKFQDSPVHAFFGGVPAIYWLYLLTVPHAAFTASAVFSVLAHRPSLVVMREAIANFAGQGVGLLWFLSRRASGAEPPQSDRPAPFARPGSLGAGTEV